MFHRNGLKKSIPVYIEFLEKCRLLQAILFAFGCTNILFL